MDNITLHFGNQVSRDSLSVLWKQEHVSGKFDIKKKILCFNFSHLTVEYKLELSYENNGKIELYRPRGQVTKFFLIQLLGAPRIYYKKEVFDGGRYQWVREVDFTPSNCIGQSYSLCLELPTNMQLPELYLDVFHYKQNEENFKLMEGSPFSSSSGHVPIVNPPTGFDLPYKIMFKINSLIHHGCVPGPAIVEDFYRLVDPNRKKKEHIETALDKLFHLKDCCFEPVEWFQEQYKEYESTRLQRTPAISLDDGLVYIHRVQITPSKVYFCGPEVNLSNRVLRNYPEDTDNFLRISFVDEDLDKMYSTALSPRSFSANEIKRTRVYDRILSTLRNGLVIGDKKFEFLAFSSSQVRENSVWMFASRPGLAAADIREWMGDFRDIRNVAKYGARLGQSFGSSRETAIVGIDETENIPDVEIKKGQVTLCFSDGIGKISEKLACIVAKKLGCSSVPSAFQIRYGGYKGVVAIDPKSSVKLSLRESMRKYNSDNTKLDVLAWSKFQPCFLNRQVITLLSNLGVKDQVFQNMQKKAIHQLNAILTDPSRAVEALEMIFTGEISKVLKEMLICGYKPDAEPFLSMMLQTFRAFRLMDMRLRTRIFVPNGRALMGCLDETRTLEYGQVFLQVSRFSMELCNKSSHMFSVSSTNPNNFICEGQVVVAKNPCLHPGDVRVLEAVNVPTLHHMVDCVVFPQKGKRPHPNECSGSDLDGDMYFVSWDCDLIPPRKIEPMEYNSAPTKQVDHDVTIEEVVEYFTDYIVNDNLGIIDNAHVVFADSEPKKAMSSKCKKLAKLHSIAVDFPKTGIVAEIPPDLHPKKYPDFMEKPNKKTYKSTSVIGKLFREVKSIASPISPVESFTLELSKQHYDLEMEVDGFKEYLNDAFENKSDYDFKLGNMMDQYGIQTEAEILSGNVLKMSKKFDKKRDLEAIIDAVKSLRMEAKNRFKEGIDTYDTDNAKAKAKASAWYHVTYHHTYYGRYNEGLNRAHFLSFAWCVYGQLMQIKKDKRSI